MYFFFKKRIYLFIYFQTGEGWEKERERNIHVWLPLVCPQLGTRLQLRYVPQLGIELVTL